MKYKLYNWYKNNNHPLFCCSLFRSAATLYPMLSVMDNRAEQPALNLGWQGARIDCTLLFCYSPLIHFAISFHSLI